MQLDNCNKNILSCFLLSLSKYISHVEKHAPVINMYHNPSLSLTVSHTPIQTHTQIYSYKLTMVPLGYYLL